MSGWLNETTMNGLADMVGRAGVGHRMILRLQVECVKLVWQEVQDDPFVQLIRKVKEVKDYLNGVGETPPPVHSWSTTRNRLLYPLA